MFDIIIIGGGPAGISAGIYAHTRGLKVLLLEQKSLGGLIAGVSVVTHYLGALPQENGRAFADRMALQAESYNLPVRYEQVKKTELAEHIKTVCTDKEEYRAKCVIIANGCHPLDLQIPGEKQLYGTYYGLNAVRDGQRFRKHRVFVVGGGDGAAKEALFLSTFVQEVVIVNLTAGLTCIDEFKQKIVQVPNITVWNNTSIQGIKGTNQLESITVWHRETGLSEEVEAQACGIFVYAGITPNSEIYPELHLQQGYINTDAKMQTELSGVFAAGDIRLKDVRQISTAVSDGTIAAINAQKYIQSENF